MIIHSTAPMSPLVRKIIDSKDGHRFTLAVMSTKHGESSLFKTSDGKTYRISCGRHTCSP